MREITLFPHLTGTSRYISIRQRLQTTHAPPEGSYLLGASGVKAHSLEDLVSAFGVELPPLIPPAQKAAYTTWLGHQEVDWSQALTPKGLAGVIKAFRGSLLPQVEEMEKSGYMEPLINGRSILESLQPIHVDTFKLRSLIDAGEPLDSFLPALGNVCNPIHYKHDTKTGRLRVEAGPKVLGMNKKHRGIIRSKYPGGKICTIDFISLEPRLALLAVGQKPEGDVYEEISKTSGFSRAKAKIATLSFLYGAGASGGVEEKLRKHIKEYFRVQQLQEIVAPGNKNGYGRPIDPEEERLMIPHWVQSTAVDVCLQGFSTLMKNLQKIVDPLFLVHDALFVDVPAANTRELSGIIAEGVMVPPFGKFSLSLNGLDEAE